jgi:hypothetical protein
MPNTTDRYADDDIAKIELVTRKVTQLDEENWRWELIGKRVGNHHGRFQLRNGCKVPGIFAAQGIAV